MDRLTFGMDALHLYEKKQVSSPVLRRPDGMLFRHVQPYRKRTVKKDDIDPFLLDAGWCGEKATWKRLANAVVIQAALDWREARQTLKKHPADRDATKLLLDAEEFFLSDDLMLFTKVKGSEILKRLRRESF